ncbi:MAG: protein kinase [Isosphaeraceae bacterium]|nr:protein kinase [Isosphaeraceae bacterium]
MSGYPALPDPSPEPSKNLVADWTLGTDSADGSLSSDSLFLPPPPAKGVVEAAKAPAGREGGLAAHLAETVDLGVNASEAPLAPFPAVSLAAPKPGELIGGFLIVSELGRGAFARVYLAEQPSLSHRLVALKVSRAVGEEPQMLARLQHTHIVPIFSVHDDPQTRVRLICMPYLGGANLAEVLEAAGTRVADRLTGRSFVEALDEVSNRFVSEPAQHAPSNAGPKALSQQDSPATPWTRSRWLDASHATLTEPVKARSFWNHLPVWRRAEPPPPGGETDAQPARQFLRSADSIQAAVWIVARLAEGLDHAHSRGLLHRDLKPSNILIAADGTPMLLDFNLSTELVPEWTADGARATLGGTLPYMSPEHLKAFEERDPDLARRVDERSDLYALGLIMFEMIAGVQPFPEPPASLPLQEITHFMIAQRQRTPSLRAVAPRVPWSLDSIAGKCLAPDADQRYGRARDLAEDLRRFLEDLPLKFAAEPSVRERFAKWARRNPQLCSVSSIATVAVFLLLALGAVMGVLSRNLQQTSARLRLHVLRAEFNECQFLLNTVSGPRDHLGRGVALADDVLAGQRFDAHGRWQPGPWVERLDRAEQAEVRARMAELILLEARAKTYLAGRSRGTDEWRKAREWAVRWLDRAEYLDPRPSSALFSDRALYLADLGLPADAAADRTRSAQTPPATSRDFALRGTSLLALGELARAEADLRRAVNLDPRSFWAWFTLGHCYYDQGRYADAAGAFGACEALEPRFAWPYMNRGLALAQAGRLAEALECYDLALKDHPRFAEALVNRALAALELDRLDDAERDLRAALALGRGDAGVYAALGEVDYRLGRVEEAERLYNDLLAREPGNVMVLAARGIFRLTRDPRGARSDLEDVLRRDPGNARARYGLARLLYREDPRAALAHVNAALDAEPALIDALVLRMLLRARCGDLAALDDVDRLRLTPTPHRVYNAACALAVLAVTAGEPKLVPRALAGLKQAIEIGYPAAGVASDPDWAPYRDRPEFRALIRQTKR